MPANPDETVVTVADPDSEPQGPPAEVAEVAPPDTVIPENPNPVSRVAHILDIKDRDRLLTEMKKFEDSVYERVYPLRVLLTKDIHTSGVASIQNHMSEVERWRETVLRFASLAKTFVSHCKGDHFIKREAGMKLTLFEKEAYQKELLAPFIGLEYWLEGLVDSIDSRVNMCKVILRLDESGQYHPNAQRVQ